MLPDIRAVIAAIVAAVGLLLATFGVVATLRVAQQDQSDSLRTDLAARGRSALPANSEPAKSGERTILIVDTPGPHLATPVPSAAAVSAPAASAPDPASPLPAIAALPPAEAPQPVETARATPAAKPPAETTPPADIAQATPPAEPPMGGPLAEPPRSDARENPSNARRTAAERARKARAARIAHERKAAKRAAQAPRPEQTSPAFGGTNTFGNINQIGGTFRQ